MLLGLLSTVRMLLWLLSMTIASSSGANILCTVSIPGSHFFLTQKVAEILANHGHNVTFLSATNETRVKMDPRIGYLTPQQGGFQTLAEYFKIMEQLVSREMLDLPSESMGLDWMLHSSQAWDLYKETLYVAGDYLTGPEVRAVLEAGEFDVIVAEETALIPMLTATFHTDIPVVGINAISDMSMVVRDRLNMPWLLASEPSFHHWEPALAAPTFKQRLVVLGRLLYAVVVFTKLFVVDFQARYFEPAGVQDIRYLLKNLQLFLVNDHPAVSFPYLVPENALYIGDIHFKGSYQLKPLPNLYLNFIHDCKHPHIIYVSFGTYLRDLGKISWLNEFLASLQSLDACIILKAAAGVPPNSLPEDRFLVVPWAPQKDLLGSGKLTYFLSHCGNNGRLESILYKVPILCMPMFADQLTNAMLVQRNGFGLVLLKEELSRETLRAKTEQLVNNRDQFVERIGRAVDIMISEPGSGEDNILFYVDQLVKYGNLDHLQNRILTEQSIFEIYCLDVVAVVVAGLLAGTTLLWQFLEKIKQKHCETEQLCEHVE